MSSNWRPRSQLSAGIQRGEWFVFDRGMKVAIVRALELGPKKTLMFRSVTYSDDPMKRSLVGYFPNLDMAAEITWREYQKAIGGLPRESGDR